jgi:hypothetical protein
MPLTPQIIILSCGCFKEAENLSEKFEPSPHLVHFFRIILTEKPDAVLIRLDFMLGLACLLTSREKKGPPRAADL